jgi:hypothetical protein
MKRLLALALLALALWGIVAYISRPPMLVPPPQFSGKSRTTIAFSCLSEAYAKLGYRKVGSPYQVQLANGRLVVTKNSDGTAQVAWEQDGKQVDSRTVSNWNISILDFDNTPKKLGIMNCDGLSAQVGTQWEDFVAALPTPSYQIDPRELDALLSTPVPGYNAAPDHLATLVAMPTISPYLLTPFPTYPSFLLTPMPKMPELPTFPTPIPTLPKFPTLP